MSKIKATYVDHMGSDLSAVNAARISYGGGSEELTKKDEKLIKYLADNRHMSPFEHMVLSVIIECPLYIRSQIHRHRTFAYNEISRRYTDKDMEFYTPPSDDMRMQSKDNKQSSDGDLKDNRGVLCHALIDTHNQQCLSLYKSLIQSGLSREQARGSLPQNLMTSFYMTGSVRNWCHFLSLRLHPHAQKEVQYVAEDVQTILHAYFPVSAQCLMGER